MKRNVRYHESLKHEIVAQCLALVDTLYSSGLVLPFEQPCLCPLELSLVFLRPAAGLALSNNGASYFFGYLVVSFFPLPVLRLSCSFSLFLCPRFLLFTITFPPTHPTPILTHSYSHIKTHTRRHTRARMLATPLLHTSASSLPPFIHPSIPPFITADAQITTFFSVRQTSPQISLFLSTSASPP